MGDPYDGDCAQDAERTVAEAVAYRVDFPVLEVQRPARIGNDAYGRRTLCRIFGANRRLPRPPPRKGALGVPWLRIQGRQQSRRYGFPPIAPVLGHGLRVGSCHGFTLGVCSRLRLYIEVEAHSPWRVEDVVQFLWNFARRVQVAVQNRQQPGDDLQPKRDRQEDHSCHGEAHATPRRVDLLLCILGINRVYPPERMCASRMVSVPSLSRH